MTRDPFRLEPPFVVSVSGGRTSAYLLRRVLDAHGGALPAGAHAVFANTGKEFAETLDFVRDLTAHWGVPIRWVEYDYTLYPSALDAAVCVRQRWREVTHATACRAGEPFERMIRRERYVPNAVARICTKWLKIKTMQAFAADALGLPEYTEALGLRHDEPTRTAKARARIAKGEDLALPLDEARTTRGDVMAFWAAQPFDLKLQPHESNCDLCLLKAQKTRMQIMRDHPGAEDWWIGIERDRGQTFRSSSRPDYAELARRAHLPVVQPARDDGDDAILDCACTD